MNNKSQDNNTHDMLLINRFYKYKVIYMKRFIEKLYGRLYGRKFRTGFYFEVMTFTILTFISIVLYLNLYFNKDSYGEYKSYYNITVEIKDGRINGKLNKYIEIKNKNNMCYIENCGFPHEGEFRLSSIKFWEVGKAIYVFESCINEEKDCFYNITNEFIHTLKEEELNNLENTIKGSLSGVLFLFLFEWLYTKYIRKFMIISEWKRRKRLRGKK